MEMKKIEVNEQAWEFFVYATLRIVPKRMFDEKKEKYREYLAKHFGYKSSELSYKKYCVFMCAVQAYIDLARTCEYKDNCDSKKIEFKNSIYNYLADNCLKGISTDDLIKGVYDKAKNKYRIFLRDKKQSEFSYGQAQKWVNMTQKYLLLLGLIKDDDGLHIPIDSYILEAFWYERNTNIKIPRSVKKYKDGKEVYYKDKYNYHREKCNYSNEKVKSWSNWDPSDYKTFTSNLPNKYNTMWEHEAWIRISEKRKGVE